MKLADLTPQQRRNLKTTDFFGNIGMLGPYWSFILGMELTAEDVRSLLDDMTANQHFGANEPVDFKSLVRNK